MTSPIHESRGLDMPGPAMQPASFKNAVGKINLSRENFL